MQWPSALIRLHNSLCPGARGRPAVLENRVRRHIYNPLNIHPKELALADNSQINRADAQFKKMQRAEDGKKAMAEYEAEQVAIRAKTERLRALRLARDAELEAAALAAPAKRVAAPKKQTAADVKPAAKTKTAKTAKKSATKTAAPTAA
jgi:hypothetical protein